MDKFHKVLAIAGTLAAICIPIVAHSVYGAGAHAQMALALAMSALGILGFTAAQPLFPGDVTKWIAAHKACALTGTIVTAILPQIAHSVYGAEPPVKLALEITSALLVSLGFVAVRPLGSSGVAALLPFLVLGGVSGCDWAPIDGMTGLTLVLIAGGVLALFVRSRWLVLALFVVSLAAPGCATPAGQEFKTCELKALPSTAQDAVASVVSIALSAGADWEAALVGLGAQIGPAQLSCVVQAVETWFEGITSKKGEISPAYQLAMQRLKSYLAEHPATACTPTRVSTIAPCDPSTDRGAIACRLIVIDCGSDEDCAPRDPMCRATWQPARLWAAATAAL